MTLAAAVAIAADAVRDTLPMLPLLFVLYAALEVLSHQEGSRLLLRSSLPRAFGPLAGALLGVIPQCGVSVFMTSLFLGGRVTTGTLVATYLATSDEAIPVLLAHGRDLRAIVALVSIKLVVGAVSGILVDAIARHRTRASDSSDPPAGTRARLQRHVETEMHHAPWSRAIAHSLRRTFEVYGWVLGITLAIGLLVEWVGLARIAAGTARHPVVTLVGAALFGLVPNCAASIAIAEGYLRGVLPFPAAVAGLCAGAGYGPILLLRRSLLIPAARILGVCLACSIAAGALVALLSVTPF